MSDDVQDPAMESEPDGKPSVKEELAGAATEITKGAIAGNAAGAATAAVKVAATSKRGRLLLVGGLLMSMFFTMMPVILPMLMLGAIVGGTSGNQQKISYAQVQAGGLSKDEVDTVVSVADHRGVSWHVLAAILANEKVGAGGVGIYHVPDDKTADLTQDQANDLTQASDWVAQRLRDSLAKQPNWAASTDIGIGGKLDDQMNLVWQDEGANTTLVRTPYIAALADLPVGGANESWGSQVIMLAINWRFGIAGVVGGCAPGSGTYTGPLPDHLSWTITAEQMGNAVTIIKTGQAASIPEQGLVIAVMTAIQESMLINLDHGLDDSLGLFQQRPSAGWGTPAEIMDPVKSSQAFYGVATHTDNPGLTDIDGWESMPLGEAAQAVQHSALPDAYAKWEPDARLIVAWVLAGHTDGTPTSTPSTSTGTRHYDVGPVKPEAQYIADLLGNMFGIQDEYGWRPSDPYPDHPSGHAIDFMVYEDRALGDRLAQYAMEHAAELKIKYLLWYQRSWYTGWPVGAWHPMEDRGGTTANHKDHVHITVNDSSSGSGSSSTSTLPHIDIGQAQSVVQTVADTIADQFDITTMIGVRPDPVYPDHPLGVAVDVPLGGDDGLGDQIVTWAETNAAQYKITYLVWKGRLWHIDDPAGQWTSVVYPPGSTAHADDDIHITATDGTTGTACCAPGSSCYPTGGSGDWVNPLPKGSYALTSPFGWRINPVTGLRELHPGQDMGTGGTTPPIVAAAPGTVLSAGDCGCGFGNLTTIDIGGGMVMYYGHQSAISTHVGAVVKAGDPIGTVGTTGLSTGNHLHLQINKDGTPTDPIPILLQHSVDLAADAG